MITVRMGVDERRYRLIRQFLDLVEDRLTPARIFGVNDHNAPGGDEYGCVSAATLEHPQVVLQLFHLDNFGCILTAALLRGNDH